MLSPHTRKPNLLSRILFRRLFIALLGGIVLLLTIVAKVLWRFPDPDSVQGFLIAAVLTPLLVGFIGSMLTLVFFSQQTEREFHEEIYREVQETLRETAKQLHSEFIPLHHFSLSNEGDGPFLKAVMSALVGSPFFFFSGLFARVAVIRIAKAECSSLDEVMLRIPISEVSITKAVRIRSTLKAMESDSNRFRNSSNEIAGREQDTGKLATLAKSNDPKEKYRYVQLMSVEAICLAYHVAKFQLIPFVIQDWDETAEYRIEMMDGAVFLGNYNSLGRPTQFSPGTSQFASDSFIYKFLYHGIKYQIGAAQRSERAGILFGPKATTEELIKALQSVGLKDITAALTDLDLTSNLDELDNEIGKLFSKYQLVDRSNMSP